MIENLNALGDVRDFDVYNESHLYSRLENLPGFF